mgnify:CR=1 FL=1
MIKVLVIGACGKMGREVVKAVCAQDNMQLVGAVDLVNVGLDVGSIVLNKEIGVNIKSDLQSAIDEVSPDVAIDFTQPSVIFNNAKILLNNGVKPVIGTTGLTDEQLAELKKLSEEKGVSALIAPNFTIGAVLMMMFAKKAAQYFDNAEIIELHHNQKKDAPSGTAVKTAQLMAQEKSDFAKNNCAETELIEGSRGGASYSNIHIHSVRMPGFIASQEVLFGAAGQIMTIRHDSMDRECYMSGVILAVNHVFNNSGFVYGLDNIL